MRFINTNSNLNKSQYEYWIKKILKFLYYIFLLLVIDLVFELKIWNYFCWNTLYSNSDIIVSKYQYQMQPHPHPPTQTTTTTTNFFGPQVVLECIPLFIIRGHVFKFIVYDHLYWVLFILHLKFFDTDSNKIVIGILNTK